MISFLLCLAVLCTGNALALTQPADTEANALKELGIFNGKEDGFALDDRPTRIETAVVLLRLLGKEKEALEENLSNSFDDVPDWADARIGYLYRNGIVRGLSDTEFGNAPADFNQTMTMILRVLGYDDGAGDFVWTSAAEKSKELGVLTPRCFEEISSCETFTRKNLVSCVFYALQATCKDGETTLIGKLLIGSAVTAEQVRNTGAADLLAAASLISRDCARYTLTLDFTLVPINERASFFITVNLPDTYLNRQRVTEYTFSIPPSSVTYENGNLYASFFICDIGKETGLTVSADVELYEYDMKTAGEYCFPIGLSREEREAYTSPTPLLESGDAAFTEAKLGRNDGTEYGLVSAIFDYTSRHMRKQVVDDEGTALEALMRGYGDCYDYSLVFAALCRANGIPARVVVGETVPDAVGHAIVEVFFEGLGWVPVDPVNTGVGTITLKHLEPDFVYLTDDVHSSVLFGGNYISAGSYGGSIECKTVFTKE